MSHQVDERLSLVSVLLEKRLAIPTSIIEGQGSTVYAQSNDWTYISLGLRAMKNWAFT